MRKLLALLIAIGWLLCSSAHASPLLLGMGVSTACPPPTANGSTISPADENCFLSAAYLGVQQFKGSADSLGNYTLTCCGGVAWGSGILATLDPCSDGTGEQCVYFLTNISTDPVQIWQVNLWHNATVQASAPGNPAISGLFLNNTHPTNCTNIHPTGCGYLQQLVGAAADGDTLEVKPMPAGVPVWYQSASLVGNGITLTFDAGSIFAYSLAAGNSGLSITGNNDKLHGGEWHHHNNGGATYSWHAVNNAQNPIFENATLHDDDTCLSAGGNNGLVTIRFMLIYHCGTFSTGTGEDHNTYVSAQTPSSPTIDTGCFDFHDNVSLNVTGGGWIGKFRQGCTSTIAGSVTDNVMGCIDTSCVMHAVLDYPCGGNQVSSHNVFENARNDSGNGFVMARFGEESAKVSPNWENCPSWGAYPTYAYNSDLDIWIFDGDGSSNPGTSVINVMCLGRQIGGVCDQDKMGWVCNLTNDVIVSNYPKVARMTLGAGCNGVNGTLDCTPAPGTDHCTDANSNRHYDNRDAAKAGEGWSGDYVNPINGAVIPCCAWPWLPAHL